MKLSQIHCSYVGGPADSLTSFQGLAICTNHVDFFSKKSTIKSTIVLEHENSGIIGFTVVVSLLKSNTHLCRGGLTQNFALY